MRERMIFLIQISYWTSAMTLRSSCASIDGSNSSGRLHMAQKKTPVNEDISLLFYFDFYFIIFLFVCLFAKIK